MAKRRVEPAPVKRIRQNRVMVSFIDPNDLAELAKEAEEAKLPVSTYARQLILRRHRRSKASA